MKRFFLGVLFLDALVFIWLLTLVPFGCGEEPEMMPTNQEYMTRLMGGEDRDLVMETMSVPDRLDYFTWPVPYTSTNRLDIYGYWSMQPEEIDIWQEDIYGHVVEVIRFNWSGWFTGEENEHFKVWMVDTPNDSFSIVVAVNADTLCNDGAIYPCFVDVPPLPPKELPNLIHVGGAASFVVYNPEADPITWPHVSESGSWGWQIIRSDGALLAYHKAPKDSLTLLYLITIPDTAIVDSLPYAPVRFWGYDAPDTIAINVDPPDTTGP